MKIFVINMDSRSDRLNFITQQMDGLGLSFERIRGVPGAQLCHDELCIFDKERFIVQFKKPITQGEMGCAVSHRSIWQKMIDEDIDHALILEDDIRIDRKLVEFLSQPRHYQCFDFLNLSSNEPYRLDQSALSILKAMQLTERPPFWQSRSVWRQIEWRRSWRIYRLHFFDKFICCECNFAPALGSGYILSQKAAKSLLKTSETMYYPIDLTWRYSSDLLRQAFLAEPIILQCLNDTDIAGRNHPYQMSIWQKVKRTCIRSRYIGRRLATMKLYGLSKL